MMKKKHLFPLAALSMATILLAYFISLQVKPAKQPALPYYTYLAGTGNLKQTETPDLKTATFEFTDQRSEKVTEQTIENKIVVADYFFVTCPGICRQMGSQMQRIYGRFVNEEDVLLLSHTSKPEEDTPEILMAYAEKMGVKNHDKWLFLTGSKKELYKVAREQYHIADEPENTDDFIHTERFVLIDKQGFIRGYYDGTSEQEVTTLIKDIELLLGSN